MHPVQDQTTRQSHENSDNKLDNEVQEYQTEQSSESSYNQLYFFDFECRQENGNHEYIFLWHVDSSLFEQYYYCVQHNRLHD